MKLDNKKQIVRIEVKGSINYTWEGSDTAATKYIQKLHAIQEQKIIETIGESKYRSWLREWKLWQKHAEYRTSRPSPPYQVHPFPLHIRIT